VTGDNLKDGADSLRAAIRLAPQDKHYVLTLAQIQVRMQEYEAAKKTLEPLLAEDVDPSIKMSANSVKTMIEEAQRYAAMRSREPETVDKAPEPQANATEAEPSARKAPRLVGRPSLKFEGAQVERGVLVSIECARGKWTLVVQTSERMLRFNVADKDKLEFYSQVADSDGTVNCGPIGKVAFIYFKPAAGQSKFDGDAVAVEFTR
jgi:hypothetical protein